MPKLISIAVLFAFTLTWNISQGQVYFNNRYDLNNGAEVIWSVLETDSGYVCAAGVGAGEILLLSLDTLGNTVSEKPYGLTGGTLFPGLSGSLIQTQDGGFALGGSVELGGFSKATLWRFDEYKDSLWMKIYGGAGYDQIGYQCKQTLDGGFIIIGVTTLADSDGDILLIKTDSLGNKEWDTTYGGGGAEIGFSVDVCNDGGYIIGGEIIDAPSDNIDNWVVKVDSVGSVEWDTSFGGLFEDLGTFVQQTQDGGYIVGGGYSLYEVPPDLYQSRPRVIKLNSLGNVEWDNMYGPVSFAGHVLIIDELQDGSFIVAGQSSNNEGIVIGSGWPIGFVFKVSSQGDSIWYREHEYDTCIKNDDYIRDMKPTIGGGFIVAGFFSPRPVAPCNDTGTQDMWVLKLDSCGCAYVGCDSACQGLVGIEELEVQGPQLIVYPNPFDYTATIQIKKAEGRIYLWPYRPENQNIPYIKTSGHLNTSGG